MKIKSDDLIDMHGLADEGIVRIELAYARDDNLLFGERIYREDARLWLHKDLAGVVAGAAERLSDQDLRLVLYDGLRTFDAQAKMLETQAVKDNPHWLQEPRLLSPPGAGAHPRGMAIDCALEAFDGAVLDMGTPFDFLAEDPSPEANPAHREHSHDKRVMENRAILDTAMNDSAHDLKMTLLHLPQEWWDFRFLAVIYEQYDPLNDSDLPPELRMVF